MIKLCVCVCVHTCVFPPRSHIYICVCVCVCIYIYYIYIYTSLCIKEIAGRKILETDSNTRSHHIVKCIQMDWAEDGPMHQSQLFLSTKMGRIGLIG